MTQEPSKQVFEDLNSPEFSQYAVTERGDILALLERMASEQAQTSIYFTLPPGTMMSSVLAVDARGGRLIFSRDSDPARNEAAVKAPALAWRSSLDGITIEFTTDKAQPDSHEGAPALAAGLPDIILRLQRRNAFRAEAPLAPPLHAALDEAGRGETEKQAVILDISALGMCLLVDLRELPLFAGQRILRCRFKLPGFGEVMCALEVRYILSAGARQADHMRRCGVRFVDVGMHDERLIARYINDLERERARLQGAALGALS